MRVLKEGEIRLKYFYNGFIFLKKIDLGEGMYCKNNYLVGNWNFYGYMIYLLRIDYRIMLKN